MLGLMRHRQTICGVLLWSLVSSTRPNLLRVRAASQRFMSSTAPQKIPWTPGRYPAARRSDHVDVYQSATKGKVEVHDPYQWLETSNDETTRWIQGIIYTRFTVPHNRRVLTFLGSPSRPHGGVLEQKCR